MTYLLLLVLLLLAATIWFAANLVRRAHDQAKLFSPQASVSAYASVSPEAAKETTQYSTPACATFRSFSSPFSASAQPAQNQEPLGFAADLYADPVDGVPFAAGERVVLCGCGVAYRIDSLDWLSGNLGGKCIQCGSFVEHRTSYMFPLVASPVIQSLRH